MESAFQANLSDVRVHVGPEAGSIGAIAFTRGSHIHFAPGQFQPHTAAGLRLLGHELAHVIQQRQGRVKNPFGTGVAVVQDRVLEMEADRLGAAAALKCLAHPSAKPQAAGPATAPARPAVSPRPGAVQPQMSEAAKKRLKNFFTLGFRKLYVSKKRAKRRAASPANVMIVPTQPPQPSPTFSEVYEKARYLHNTRKEHAVSIHKTGLLNYNDRTKVFGDDIGGLSALGGEYKGDEKKGVFFGSKAFSQENRQTLSGVNVRMVLPPSRNNKPIGWWDDQPKPSGPGDTRLFRDEKYRGGLYSPASVGKDSVWYGKFSELDETNDQAKIQTICQSLADYFPDPKPTWQEVYKIYLKAIEEGYVSD